MKLPKDIINRIHQEFPIDDIVEVEQILNQIYTQSWNVRSDQLCRSILYLSSGSLKKMKEELLPMLDTEPRDVIFEAEYKAGGPGHYFSIPFSEIDMFFDKLYKEEDELPPESFW